MRRRLSSDTRSDKVVGFRAALRNPTFARLFVAESQSIVGDQLARVALAVLVYDRSGSVQVTAGVYAATFLPMIVGGLALAGLGDRLPRRALMVAVDLLRAAAFAGMAVPGLSLGWVVTLLVLAVLLGPVFTAAAVARLAEALTPAEFRSATGLRMVTNQAAQVAGFLLGGAVVAAIHPGGALLVNAATFALSAVLIAVFLPREHHTVAAGRPADPPTSPSAGRRVPGAIRAVLRSRGTTGLMFLTALTGLFVVPEGLSVPLGDQIGATAAETGVLFAAIPLGSAVGVVIITRWVTPCSRARVMRIMAVACGAPLVVTWAEPGLVVVVTCWFVSGVGAAYVVEAMSMLMAGAVPELRSQLVGVSSAAIVGAQGLGIVIFGFIGGAWSPSTAVALAGVLGVGGAASVVRWTQTATVPGDERPPLVRDGTAA